MKKFLGTYSCAVYLLMLFTISSCQSDLGSSNFINIAKQYDVYITQVLTEDGGQGALEFFSIEEYNCENAFLSYQANIDDTFAEIILNDIEVEGNCVEYLNIVSETVDVEVNDSSKDLVINIQGAVENKGRFTTNIREFNLDMESIDGLKINKSKINRINKNLVWGHFKSNDEGTQAELIDFLQSINLQYNIEKGDYGLFYVDQNGRINEEAYDQNELTSFILFSSTQFDDVITQINELSENDNSLVFLATNYDGRSINIQ